MLATPFPPPAQKACSLGHRDRTLQRCQRGDVATCEGNAPRWDVGEARTLPSPQAGGVPVGAHTRPMHAARTGNCSSPPSLTRHRGGWKTHCHGYWQPSLRRRGPSASRPAPRAAGPRAGPGTRGSLCQLPGCSQGEGGFVGQGRCGGDGEGAVVVPGRQPGCPVKLT